MPSIKLTHNFRRRYGFVKRTYDVLLSIVLVVVLSPVLILTWIVIKVTSKGPAIFWSDRVGQNGRVFRMPKFRSMHINSRIISREIASQQDIHITSIGNFIRKTSIDELPQLFSILKGDMSLIGPRPLLINDVATSERNKHPEIYSVRPGITGLAQVNGRNFVSPRRKSRYDAFYASKMCLIFDVKIALKTVRILFNRSLVQ